MPRRPDASWELKVAIWDLAAKLGEVRLVAIQRSLQHLLDKGELCEDVPDERTIKAIIAEMQSLSLEVLDTLPKHIWRLRKDFDSIRLQLRGAGPSTNARIQTLPSVGYLQAADHTGKLPPDVQVGPLRLGPPRVDFEKDGDGPSCSVAKYAVVDVVNEGDAEARDCSAWLDVLPPGPEQSFRLHWRDTPFENPESRITIDRRKPECIHIAVGMLPAAFISSFPAGSFVDARVVREAPTYFPSLQGPWDGEGCWLAEPMALENPSRGLESYLPVGEHRVRVNVCWEGREIDSAEYIVTSPASWHELTIRGAQPSDREAGSP